MRLQRGKAVLVADGVRWLVIHLRLAATYRHA
jgi:hypothetical protein